jgi:hypothetical protein
MIGAFANEDPSQREKESSPRHAQHRTPHRVKIRSAPASRRASGCNAGSWA